MNKLELLEKFELPNNPDAKLEQYFTSPSLALDFISKLDVKDKIIIDLASGPGVLGFAALLNGAKKVIMVDVDPNAIKLSKKNYDLLKQQKEIGKCIFINKDISLLRKADIYRADIVILNPPFGTTEENKKLDVVFLKKAMKLSNTIMSMHKTSAKDFIRKIIQEKNFKIREEIDFLFPIHKQYSHHKEDVLNIEVTLFIIKKEIN